MDITPDSTQGTLRDCSMERQRTMCSEVVPGMLQLTLAGYVVAVSGHVPGAKDERCCVRVADDSGVVQ